MQVSDRQLMALHMDALVVISSHGRTRLARVIMGSVAESFIHGLDLRIIVDPALATESVTVSTLDAEPTAAAAHAPVPADRPRHNRPAPSQPWWDDVRLRCAASACRNLAQWCFSRSLPRPPGRW
jgi:hypothetical protein